MQCSKGEEYSEGQCWKQCPGGYTGIGPQCMKDCPPGFKSTDTVCLKPTLPRGPPIMPRLEPCAPNQRDDGLNCWNTLECSYIPNGQKLELVCSGTNAIGVPFKSRQSCAPGYSLFNGMCYVSCPTGYDSVGSICAKQCPSGYTDMKTSSGLAGLQCAKASISRDFGTPLLAGLREITSDPRKSTLLLRYNVQQSTDASVSATLTRQLSNSFDPCSLAGQIIDFITGPGIITLLKWLAVVAFFFFGVPLISPFFQIFGALFTPVAKGVGTAVGSVGEAAGKVVSASGSLVGSTISSTGQVLGKAIVDEAS